MKFKGIKNVDERIAVWGWMDDVVHATKPKSVVEFWENNGVPRQKRKGILFTIKTKEGEYPLTHWALSANRYWYEREFAKCDWKLVCETFAKTMGF